MKKPARSVVSLMILLLGLVACGDREKTTANQEWESFAAGEIATIRATSGEGDEKPMDFKTAIVEVKEGSYRFKGTVSFKKGNAFHEQPYAFVDGKWMHLGGKVAQAEKPSAEAATEREKKSEKSEKTLEQTKEEIEVIEKKIETLKKEIGAEEAGDDTGEEPTQEQESVKRTTADTEPDLEEEWP